MGLFDSLGGGISSMIGRAGNMGQQVVNVVDRADPGILHLSDQLQNALGNSRTIHVNGIANNLENVVQQISSQVPPGSIGALNFFSSGMTGGAKPLLDQAGNALAQFGGIGASNFDQANDLLGNLKPLMAQNPVGGLNFFGSNMGLQNQGNELLNKFGSALGTSANAHPMNQLMSLLGNL